MLFSGSVKPVKLIGSKRENFKKIKLQLKRQSVRGEGERLGEIKKKEREMAFDALPILCSWDAN